MTVTTDGTVLVATATVAGVNGPIISVTHSRLRMTMGGCARMLASVQVEIKTRVSN